MSATITVSINGTSLATNNIFVHGTPDSWLSTPTSSRGIINLPNRVRGVLSRTDAVASRVFAIPFRVATYSLADRLTYTDYLKALHRQQVTIKVDDGSWTRELVGTITDVRLSPVTRWDTTICDGVLTVLAGDPLWRNTSATTTASITTVTTIVLGTGPTEDWSIDTTVSGGSDARTITYTFGGTTSYTCTWTGTIGGNTLHVNADTGSVLNNVTNAISGWVGGFPALDPANGTVTLTMTCTSGTASSVVTYRKKYY